MMATKQLQNGLSQLKPHIDTRDLEQRIELMLIWFMDIMNDAKTHRFYYERNVHKHLSTHESSPIRDIAAAWVTSKILIHLQSKHTLDRMQQSKIHSLSLTIKNTIRHYTHFIKYFASDAATHDNTDCAYISSTGVAEVLSTIAHSAFLILSILSAHAYDDTVVDQNTLHHTLPCLVNGILNNQNSTCCKDQTYGAFKVDFEGNRYGYYRGIELYPAEAMLALLSYYHFLSVSSNNNDVQSKQSEIIHSIRIAFRFYSKYFYDGHIGSHYTVFFSNWQSQLFGLLFDTVEEHQDVKCIGNYVLDLQHSILTSVLMRNLNENGKRYSKLSTVEVACGLESLCDGLRVALKLKDITKAKTICKGIEDAVLFLNHIQNITNNGGFGHAVHVNLQRIDVTGHVANAYMKLINILKSE
eukprot:56495_1